ncbi:hypothetical protein LCGC14_0406510 [marine sediment metagenome]|uniref:HIRAN domain-containing protein n=1 Tax=marine sediment metagenome TaxID=412755 RepID=A0A0F9VH26_9ZZZZ
MPRGFDNCVKKGGRVRTIKPKGKDSSVYMHVCYLNGKSYSGYIKHASAKTLAKHLGKK